MSSIDYHYDPDDTPMSEKFTGKQEEAMSTPDLASAAVDVIAKVTAKARGHDPSLLDLAMGNAVLDYLREHPEDGPWPVMTVSEATKSWHVSPRGSHDEWLGDNAPLIVIPDPDPPAAAADWTANYLGVVCSCGETSTDEVHKTPKTITCRECGKSWTINVVVEAANGGGAESLEDAIELAVQIARQYRSGKLLGLLNEAYDLAAEVEAANGGGAK